MSPKCKFWDIHFIGTDVLICSWKFHINLLTRTPIGYFRALPADAGEGRPPPLPLTICQTAGPILHLKTAVGSPGLELSEYVAKFYLKVTDDVTGWVKGQILNYLSSLASPGNAAELDQKKAAEMARLASGILLSTLLSLLWPCVK